jgi:hypothetical protein
MHVPAHTLHALMCLHVVYVYILVLETVREKCFMLDYTNQRVKEQISELLVRTTLSVSLTDRKMCDSQWQHGQSCSSQLF